MKSVWEFPICLGGERLKNEAGAKLHATQKPEALLHRIISSCTKPGDLVLDPFLGTGTTAAVAKRLGRNYCGIELDATYLEAARKRIDAIKFGVDADKPPIEGTSKPKIPFRALVETGRIAIGTRLHLYASPSKPSDVWATVRDDGTIQVGDLRGSIHQVGKTLLKQHSCNGWDIWRFTESGVEWPIDILRLRAAADSIA